MAKTKSHPASFLDNELSKIESYIPQRDYLSPSVSKVDVAWHLDHMLRTIIVVCQLLETSNPADFKSNFNLSRTLIYVWGDFPRGVAKAPKVALPPEVIETKNLYLQIETAKAGLNKLQNLHPKSHFEHPYFSVIDKKQSMRFLKIHTSHHLKIVRDIVKKHSE